jgi:uncharacterized membrane protein YfcA
MGLAEYGVIAAASIVAAAIASISGFGIGSILTPTLSLWFDAKLAVAAVSIPHVIGTALRFAMLEAKVDASVMWNFGLASAAGGLAGALLGTMFESAWLLILLAILLLFVGVGEFMGYTRRLEFRGAAAWIAGVLSGLLGGLVGNQGGLRSAALLGFRLERHTFVATATAIGLFVDGARMPVYFFTHGEELRQMAGAIVVSSGGVVAGTIAGQRVLSRIPEPIFRRVVAVLLVALGVALLYRAV